MRAPAVAPWSFDLPTRVWSGPNAGCGRPAGRCGEPRPRPVATQRPRASRRAHRGWTSWVVVVRVDQGCEQQRRELGLLPGCLDVGPASKRGVRRLVPTEGLQLRDCPGGEFTVSSHVLVARSLTEQHIFTGHAT